MANRERVEHYLKQDEPTRLIVQAMESLLALKKVFGFDLTAKLEGGVVPTKPTKERAAALPVPRPAFQEGHRDALAKVVTWGREPTEGTVNTSLHKLSLSFGLAESPPLSAPSECRCGGGYEE